METFDIHKHIGLIKRECRPQHVIEAEVSIRTADDYKFLSDAMHSHKSVGKFHHDEHGECDAYVIKIHTKFDGQIIATLSGTFPL
jgi:hypothetical protein